jgi:hypothetical protein
MKEKQNHFKRKTALGILIGLTLASFTAIWFIAPIPQDPQYQIFADQRILLNIPHFWNVVSNMAFFIAGVYGLWTWRRSTWAYASDRWPWLTMAGGLIFVALGSGYFHLQMNNQTLFWDRLPMVVVFMSLFCAILVERLHPRLIILLGPLVLLGVLSVEIWRRSELAGAGDLRLYGFVQYFPMLAIPLILWLFPKRYDHPEGFWIMIGFYAFAKLLEIFDKPVFCFFKVVSGHTLKHILAAAALGSAFHMLAKRKPQSFELQS